MDRITHWDARRQDIVDEVAEYGWHCENVLANWGSGAYAYTVGLFEKYQHPELVVFGLKPTVANLALLRAVEQLQQSRAIDRDGHGDDALLKGCDCELIRVPQSVCVARFGVHAWFYGGRQVPVLQIVWPSMKRTFPWHGEASACAGAGVA